MKMHKGFFVVLACFCSLFIFAAEGYSQTCTEPVMFEYNSLTYTYSSTTAAYNAALGFGLTDFTLKFATDGLLEENVNFDQEVTVELEGGWDCSFLTQDNNVASRITGSLTISAGTVIASNIVLSAPALCEPGDPNNFPGNPEICDCLDNNCNGLVDDGLTFDADGDGYTAIGSCEGTADDCNDYNPNVHPYGELYGDGIDQDCDGIDTHPLYDIDPDTGRDCYWCHDVYQTDNTHTLVEVPVAECGDCHSERDSSVRTGHYGQVVRTAGNNMAVGDTIRCRSCHDQGSLEHPNFGANVVWAKVVADYQTYGEVTCHTCHENHPTEHLTGNAHDFREIDPSCGQCHTSDTTVLGNPGTGTLTSDEDVYALHRSDCALCHNYTGTKICFTVIDKAIEDGLNDISVTCGDCHAAHHSPETNQVSYDPLVDTSQPSQEGCANCHYDYDIANGTSFGLSTWETILVEHDLDGIKDGSSNTCANCHNYDGLASASLADVQNAIASGGPVTCANCHTDKVPDVAHGVPTTGKHLTHIEMAGINSSCSYCHSTPPYFNSGTDTNGDSLYDLAETDVCNPCHQDWDPAGLPAEQDYKAGWSVAGFSLECTDCHGEYVDNGDNIPLGGRRAVTGEFPLADAHAHYGTVLDSVSCQVCHDHANHADGTVNLLDPDGGAGYNFVYTTDLTADPDLSNFCANCHDDNGATRLVLPLDPLDPFANGNAPPDVATRFMGTLQWNEWYGDFCFGYEGSNRPVNSHHDISDTDQIFSGAKLECLNCHGAHSSSASQKITDPFDSNLAWTGTLNEFCLACHAGGHEPMDSTFPADAAGPTFYTPPPTNAPGESCGTDMVYDCSDNCINQAAMVAALANGSCDDLAGLNLNCYIFSYDNGDCAPVNTPFTSCGTDMYWDCSDSCLDLITLTGDPADPNDYGALGNGTCDEAAGLDLNCVEYKYDYNGCDRCIGNNCSAIGGIDSCSYDFDPWWIQMTWTNEAHGSGSKRQWPGYSGAPAVPEMDCVACHDSHGSYDAVTNPGGNPYMLRDYVDGTQYNDDGIRSAVTNVPGVAGTVVITSPTPEDIGPQLGAQLCVKCHADWLAAYTWHASCGGCLTCHSHGMAWGASDWGGAPSDATGLWCP